MNFFKKVKVAIFNFEKYKDFADENVTKVIKYFFQIVLIFVIVATLATAIPKVNFLFNGIEYIKNNIPNFNIKDDKLAIESEEPILIEDNHLSLNVIINPKINGEEANKIIENQKEYDNIVVFTEKKIFLKIVNTSGIMAYDYKILTDSLKTDEISKQSILEYFDNSGYVNSIIAICLIMFAYLLFTYIIVTLVDVLLFSVLALITSKLYKVGLNYKQCFNISIYALTLPIVLNIIYVLVNAFTGFTIQYFQIMYYVIAYIYIITTILIIKTDYNKNGSDLIKITEEIKIEKVDEEQMEETEDKPKDEKKKKEKKKEKDDTTPEPDPGNA